jgi:hypothetical protein
LLEYQVDILNYYVRKRSIQLQRDRAGRKRKKKKEERRKKKIDPEEGRGAEG